jgi:hypothetical protein
MNVQTLLFALDQAGILEDTQVFGHGRFAHFEPIRNLTGRETGFRQVREDAASRR